MGSIPSSVLTVQSPAPHQDALTIQKIFPEKFRMEDVDGSESKVLVDKEERMAIFLVISVERSTITWLVEEGDLQEAFRRSELVQETAAEGLSFGEINLPSGASIVMLPPAIVSSSLGRQALAGRLTRTSPEGIDNGEYRGSLEGADLDAALQPLSPVFPSLQVKLLEQDGELRPDFPLNSQTPVDFETELFKGKMLFVLRPSNPEQNDPYWNERIFAKKKRRIVLQIQGKFKKEPQGVVYAGAEVSSKMELGLVTRGLCGILLRLVESFNSNVHYSFGDSDGLEKPHIVAPAYTFFERIVSTAPGETPPPIDQDFEESQESINRRKNSKSEGKWNTVDTYSLSFYSMYIDLPTWHLVSLPVSGDISLKTFWGNSLLRICMYEKTGSEKQHLQESNRYAFAIQAKFLGKNGRMEDEEEDDIIHWHTKPVVVPEGDSEMRRSNSQLFPALVEEEADEEYFFDAEESNGEDERWVAEMVPSKSAELLSTIDSVCPAWLDICSSRGGYSRAYAIITTTRATFRPAQACEDLIQDATAAMRIVDTNFSPRISTSERIRRTLGLVLAKREQAGISSQRIQSFEAMESRFDNVFLRRKQPSLSEKENSIIRLSGFAARAISDRHWVEEWVKVTGRNISFYHPEKRRSQFRVTLSSITKVERLSDELSPNFPGHHFLAIETLGRSVYLMFASETERDTWLDVISQLKKVPVPADDNESLSSADTNASPRLMEIDNPAEEFLHKSSMWSCKSRRILNCAHFRFRSKTSKEDPLMMVEEALRRALEPTSDYADDFEQRRAFLDSTAALKQANVEGLPEEARLTFFLNLYHVMIMHSYLILGPPDSSLKWISYFNNIAYEVNDDIFSLSELEHCIIRARMAYPSQFISRFVLPKSRYPRIALTKADYRINFALNCGSKSNPASIQIYRVGRLQQQLDAACRLYLTNVTITRKSARDVVIQIPRVCQWFADDFGSEEGLLNKIEPYLEDEKRRILAACWLSIERHFDMKAVTIKYLSYSFECRPLTL